MDTPSGESLPSSRPGEHHAEGMDDDQGQSSPKRHRVKPLTRVEIPPNQRQEEKIDRKIKWTEEWEQGGFPQKCQRPAPDRSFDQT